MANQQNEFLKQQKFNSQIINNPANQPFQLNNFALIDFELINPCMFCFENQNFNITADL